MSASAPTVEREKQVGLRFVSGARMRSAVYVVRPAVPERDPLTGRQIGLLPPLRAVFKEHQFSSKQAQIANRWSDEERKQVEAHLLRHEDFGRGDGRGIFLDKSTSIPQVIPDYLADERPLDPAAAAVPVHTGERCIWLDEQGEVTVQCSEQATDEETGFCELHAGIAAAADD